MLHKLLQVIFIKIYFLYKVYISPICVMYIFLLSGLADDLSNQGYHKNNYYNNDQADTYYDCGKFIRFFHQIKYIFAVIHNLTIMGCRIVFRYICNAISICSGQIAVCHFIQDHSMRVVCKIQATAV